MLDFIQTAWRLIPTQIDLDTDHEGSFKRDQPTAHQYAAHRRRRFLTMATKQAETVEGSIDVCSFMRTYHSRPAYAQKRSNEILSSQIEFFAWLISVRGRCCTHTRRISKHFSGFHLPQRTALSIWKKKNTGLIKIFHKNITSVWHLRYGKREVSLLFR